MKIVVNCETAEITQRELNAQELEQQVIDAAAAAAQQIEANAKAAAKAAVLEQLGITAEQAKLLLS